MLAAVAMEVLMELGQGLEEAAQQVASAAQKWPGLSSADRYVDNNPQLARPSSLTR
jgi:hypothetical protein